MDVLKEFLDSNLTRVYPLQDSSSGKDISGDFVIPESFMSDMRLHTTRADGYFYISNIAVYSYVVTVEISFQPDSGDALVVGSFLNINISSEINEQSVAFTPTTQDDVNFRDLEGTVGVLYIGSCGDLKSYKGLWNFSSENTKILDSLVLTTPVAVRSLSVGDRTLSGNIILEEGAGVTLSTEYDSDTDTSTITISATETASDEIVLSSDSDIISALAARFGQPLVSINNVTPDSVGNLTLQGSDCVDIFPDGENNLVIENPCGKPCCDEETFLDPVYRALNQLNAKKALTATTLDTVESVLKDVVSSLKDLESILGLGGS
jgi:predicted nuclease of predicted toxin-antitoxin system